MIMIYFKTLNYKIFHQKMASSLSAISGMEYSARKRSSIYSKDRIIACIVFKSSMYLKHDSNHSLFTLSFILQVTSRDHLSTGCRTAACQHWFIGAPSIELISYDCHVEGIWVFLRLVETWVCVEVNRRPWWQRGTSGPCIPLWTLKLVSKSNSGK